MSLGKAPYDENRRSTLRNGGLHMFVPSQTAVHDDARALGRLQGDKCA